MQGELEDALAAIFRSYGPPPRVTVAGRTDAGVHALGQVAHLDLTTTQLASLSRAAGTGSDAQSAASLARRHELSAASLARRLNGIAGRNADLHVVRSALAPHGFDARFSATWRRYHYRVADADAPRNPLERNYTLWYPTTLDLERMDRAAAALVGLHDWASYCRPREGATTIRTLQEFGWVREPDGVLVTQVKADAFCHNMVRALVGATIAVGEGKLEADQLVVIRDARMRTNAFKVVPAKGLILEQVGYPDDADLQARAVQTRTRRAPVVDRLRENGLL